MIKQLINKSILLTSVTLLPFIACANFTIAPIKLKIQKDEKITALTLQNNSDKVTSFQLTAFKVESENGQDVDKETKDLLVTPLSFRLAPGDRKSVV